MVARLFLRLAALSTFGAMLKVGILLVAAATAWASAEQPGSPAYALVLADAGRASEAAAFTQFLIEVRGFDRENVVDLLEPTRDEIIRLFGDGTGAGGMHQFLSEPQRHASEIVIFYSGHGVWETDGRMYVAIADLSGQEVRDKAIALEHLMAGLDKLPAKSVTVFLNLCTTSSSYSYPSDAPPMSPPDESAGFLNDGTHRINMLVAACGESLIAWRHGDNAPQSAFTYHLLSALYGQADSDGNGSVTGLEVQRYLDIQFSLDTGRASGRPPAAHLYGDSNAILGPKTDAGPPLRAAEDLKPWPKSLPRLQPFTVRTIPANAQVRILGVDSIRPKKETLRSYLVHESGFRIEDGYSDGMLLPSGIYRVEVGRDGFETIQEEVSHGSQDATVRRIKLRQTGRAWTHSNRFTDCEHCPEMTVVPTGACLIGCAPGEDCDDDAKPVHNVRFDRQFAISVNAVTDVDWNLCVAANACEGHRSEPDGDFPVSNVSWHDAQSYVAWLSKESGRSYRLPSEAEWEYAARGACAAGDRNPTRVNNDTQVEEVSETEKEEVTVEEVMVITWPERWTEWLQPKPSPWRGEEEKEEVTVEEIMVITRPEWWTEWLQPKPSPWRGEEEKEEVTVEEIMVITRPEWWTEWLQPKPSPWRGEEEKEEVTVEEIMVITRPEWWTEWLQPKPSPWRGEEEKEEVTVEEIMVITRPEWWTEWLQPKPSTWRGEEEKEEVTVEEIVVTALPRKEMEEDVTVITMPKEMLEWADPQCMPTGCVPEDPFGVPGATCESATAPGPSDMGGMRWEWVQDCCNSNYEGAPSDGSPWLDGDCSCRMLRGGPDLDGRSVFRPTARNKLPADARGRYNTFRVAVPVDS